MIRYTHTQTKAACVYAFIQKEHTTKVIREKRSENAHAKSVHSIDTDMRTEKNVRKMPTRKVFTV